MNWAGAILLFALYTCVRGELFPQGHQWIYSYHALLRSGTVLPSEAHSQWDLHAQLTVTAAKDHIVLQLSEFNTSIYNGLRDAVPQDMNPLPIPKDAHALGTPFLVHYVDTQVDGISVSSEDPLWAVNMKRAIASILQLKLDKLGDAASFVSENNLYGHCKGIEYSVVNNTEYIYVRKVIDNLKCEVPPVKWSSATPFRCLGASEDTYSSTTTREYTLAQSGNSIDLKHVMSSRRLYVQPFQASAEAQQVYQYQVYQLLNTNLVDQQVTIPENLIKKSLKFEHNLKDLTQGRITQLSQDAVLEQIKYLFYTLVNTLDHLNLKQNTKELHNQVLTQLYYNSFLLDSNSLKTLYNDIVLGTSYQQETKRNIFLELLPQIGTSDSVHFMKELIVKRELKDLTSIKLLSVFPFYVRHHSEKLLSDLEVFMNLGDNYDSSIRQTGILSFATLVYQTFDAGQCSLEVLEDYAKKYFNLFTESTSYEQRMLYLQGLDNLQVGSVFEYLTSVIQNNDQSRHIRFLAVWASMLNAPFKPDEIYKLYWPILIDRTQHLEMRVAAFTMLLIAQPTNSRLLTLYWYMQGETDPHLYNFFYSTLISLQKTTYPCYKHLGKLALHVTRFLRPPKNMQQWMTGNYLLDYINTDSSFGGMMQLFLVGNPVTDSPTVLYITFNSYATGKNLNQVAVYLKLQGVSDTVKNMLNKETMDNVKMDKLIKLLEKSDVKLLPPEEIHLEMIIKVQGKSVFCKYFDSNSLKKITLAMVNLKMLLDYHLNYQSIFLPYLSEHMEPSDVGTLVLRGIVSNSVASMRGNSTSNNGNKINTYNFDLDFRYYTYTTNFLEVYNPIANLWHGVHKSRSLQGRFLFNGTVLIDVKKSVIRLSEERGGTEYISMILHSQSMTYIIGNTKTQKILQSHCPHCVQDFVVNGGKKKTNEDLMNVPFEIFGTKLETSLFDCEKYQDHKRLFSDVYSAHQSNSEILPITEPLLFGLHLVDYITYILPHRSCGILIYLKPFYDEPTELALTLSLQSITTVLPMNEEIDLESTRGLTLTHRKLPNGPDLQYWNATLDLLSTPDMRNNNVNLTVEHVGVTGLRQKLCVKMNLIMPEKQLGFLSVKPSDKTFATVKAAWGPSQENSETCPTKAVSSIESIITAAISDEQKSIAQSAERWPYKQCREGSVGRNHTPFSMPCYLAAKELAIYRKYTSDITFSNMPDWFLKMAQKVQSLVGLLHKESSPDDMLLIKSNTETKVKTAFEFSATEPKVNIKLNDKEATIELPAFKFIENVRFLLQNDWNVNLGFNKICVISSKSVSTIDNRTTDIEEIKLRKKEVLVAADCSKHLKFGIFLDSTSNPDEVAFTMYAGIDTVTVKPSQTILITLNDKPFTGKEDSVHLNIWRLQDDVVLVKTKYNEPSVSVFYTREYMLVTVQGIFTGKVCGLCSVIKSNNNK